MTKQKRMVYIYEENLPFYESLANKSDFINKALARGRTMVPHADPNNVDYVKARLAAIDEERRIAAAERRKAAEA